LHEAGAAHVWPERVYLGVGTNEEGVPGCKPGDPPPDGDPMVPGVRQFEAVLKTAGLDRSRLLVVVAPCATHTHAAWAARLPAALTFLFGPGS
jgi:hypothetical protein